MFFLRSLIKNIILPVTWVKKNKTVKLTVFTEFSPFQNNRFSEMFIPLFHFCPSCVV